MRNMSDHSSLYIYMRAGGLRRGKGGGDRIGMVAEDRKSLSLAGVANLVFLLDIEFNLLAGECSHSGPR